MWLFTKTGFFSVVRASAEDLTDARKHKEAQDGDVFSIRARVRKDLEALLASFPDDPHYRRPIVELKGRDYPFRIYCSPDTLGIIMQLFVDELDYGNFKDEVKKTQGYERADLYSRVWSVMYQAESKLIPVVKKRDNWRPDVDARDPFTFDFDTLPPEPKRRRFPRLRSRKPRN